MRRQKRASCTNSDYKKMANLGKNGEYAKIHQGFGQIFK